MDNEDIFGYDNYSRFGNSGMKQNLSRGFVGYSQMPGYARNLDYSNYANYDQQSYFRNRNFIPYAGNDPSTIRNGNSFSVYNPQKNLMPLHGYSGHSNQKSLAADRNFSRGKSPYETQNRYDRNRNNVTMNGYQHRHRSSGNVMTHGFNVNRNNNVRNNGMNYTRINSKTASHLNDRNAEQRVENPKVNFEGDDSGNTNFIPYNDNYRICILESEVHRLQHCLNTILSNFNNNFNMLNAQKFQGTKTNANPDPPGVNDISD